MSHHFISVRIIGTCLCKPSNSNCVITSVLNVILIYLRLYTGDIPIQSVFVNVFKGVFNGNVFSHVCLFIEDGPNMTTT